MQVPISDKNKDNKFNFIQSAKCKAGQAVALRIQALFKEGAEQIDAKNGGLKIK